jgi:hypothetical protein
MAGDIHAELGLGISQFLDAVNRVDQRLSQVKAKTEGASYSIGKGLSTTMAAAGAAVAAGAAAAMATLVAGAAGLKNAFDLGGRLVDLSSQIGTSAGNAQVLETAFTNAGLGADSVVSTVGKMQKAIAAAAGGGNSEMFDKLGLDPEQLLNSDPTEAFKKIGEAIASIENPTARAAASMEIFGKSGGRLLSLFGDKGALSFAAEQLGGQSALLDDVAADFDVISDTLGGAFKKLQGFFVGMGARMVEQLKPAFEAFNKLDLSGIGQRFGEKIASAIDYFRAAWQAINFADAGNLVGAALSLGIKSAVNLWWSHMWGTIRALGQFFHEYIKSAVEIFSVVATADFWKGMGNAIIGIALQFQALLLGTVSKVLGEVSKIPGFGKLAGAAEATGEMAQTQQTKADDYFKSSGQQLQPLFDTIAERLEKTISNVTAAYKKGFRDTGELIGTGNERKVIADILEKVQTANEALRAGREAAANSNLAGAANAGNAANAVGTAAPAGTFAQAVNFLMGRSVNEMIYQEAQTQTEQLKDMNSTLKDIKEKLNKPPQVNIKTDPVARFN